MFPTTLIELTVACCVEASEPFVLHDTWFATEFGINPGRKKQSQSFPWFEEIDRILVVGMRYGPRGTQEAVKRVRQLTPELAPAQVWHRLRHLREKERRRTVAPVDLTESAIEILREGYRSGAEERRKQSKPLGRFTQDSRDMRCRDLPGVKIGWTKSEQKNRRAIDDLGPEKRKKNYLCSPAMSRSKRLPKSSNDRNNQFASGSKVGP